jgi:uncharacterized membrane protein YcfT
MVGLMAAELAHKAHLHLKHSSPSAPQSYPLTHHAVHSHSI